MDKKYLGYRNNRFNPQWFFKDYQKWAETPDGNLELEQSKKDQSELIQTRKRRKYETAKQALESTNYLSLKQRKQYRKDLELFDE